MCRSSCARAVGGVRRFSGSSCRRGAWADWRAPPSCPRAHRHTCALQIRHTRACRGYLAANAPNAPNRPPSFQPPLSVVPAHAGTQTAVVGGAVYREPCTRALAGQLGALVLRRALGLCPRSSLGRRILERGLGAAHVEIPLFGPRAGSAASAGMTERCHGNDGGGGSWSGGWVLLAARYPRQARV